MPQLNVCLLEQIKTERYKSKSSWLKILRNANWLCKSIQGQHQSGDKSLDNPIESQSCQTPLVPSIEVVLQRHRSRDQVIKKRNQALRNRK